MPNETIQTDALKTVKRVATALAARLRCPVVEDKWVGDVHAKQIPIATYGYAQGGLPFAGVATKDGYLAFYEYGKTAEERQSSQWHSGRVIWGLKPYQPSSYVAVDLALDRVGIESIVDEDDPVDAVVARLFDWRMASLREKASTHHLSPDAVHEMTSLLIGLQTNPTKPMAERFAQMAKDWPTLKHVETSLKRVVFIAYDANGVLKGSALYEPVCDYREAFNAFEMSRPQGEICEAWGEEWPWSAKPSAMLEMIRPAPPGAMTLPNSSNTTAEP